MCKINVFQWKEVRQHDGTNIARHRGPMRMASTYRYENGLYEQITKTRHPPPRNGFLCVMNGRYGRRPQSDYVRKHSKKDDKNGVSSVSIRKAAFNQFCDSSAENYGARTDGYLDQIST